MRIPVADDDLNDAALMERAFQKAGVTFQVELVRDGQEVLDFLQRAGSFAERAYPEPNTVVLDIKMPRMNGLEVLAWLKSNEKFRRIPVVMFSSSCQPQDVNRAYVSGPTHTW